MRVKTNHKTTLTPSHLEFVEAARQGLQLGYLQTHRDHLLGQTATDTFVEARAEGFEKWREKVHQHIRLVAEHVEALGHWVDTLGVKIAGMICGLGLLL